MYTTLGTYKVKPKPFSPLCFTAEQDDCIIKLRQYGSPEEVVLEYKINDGGWSEYLISDIITLNEGDKIYMRNASETDTGFSIDGSNYYRFAMTGKIGASGDVTSLLNKNGTTTVSNYCFNFLFYGCTSLTTSPELPVTTLGTHCCYSMFAQCTSLTTLPELPAVALRNYCYYGMFYGCTNIKLSQIQTGEYQIPYRIPTTGTGTSQEGALVNMFYDTGGTYSGTPGINTTYYTSNQVI